jgi:hypothetical protein
MYLSDQSLLVMLVVGWLGGPGDGRRRFGLIGDLVVGLMAPSSVTG